MGFLGFSRPIAARPPIAYRIATAAADRLGGLPVLPTTTRCCFPDFDHRANPGVEILSVWT
jgi:hypothetical protein